MKKVTRREFLFKAIMGSLFAACSLTFARFRSLLGQGDTSARDENPKEVRYYETLAG